MLTKRLAACAALVTEGGVVCDVGTDHAYLPAELLRQNRCPRAVVTDIHAGPLEAARRTLTETGVLHVRNCFCATGWSRCSRRASLMWWLPEWAEKPLCTFWKTVRGGRRCT